MGAKKKKKKKASVHAVELTPRCDLPESERNFAPCAYLLAADFLSSVGLDHGIGSHPGANGSETHRPQPLGFTRCYVRVDVQIEAIARFCTLPLTSACL